MSKDHSHVQDHFVTYISASKYDCWTKTFCWCGAWWYGMPAPPKTEEEQLKTKRPTKNTKSNIRGVK